MLQPGQVGYVGRRDDSVVVVTDPRVSREHVRLSWGGQGWVLENVGRSGTFVSGQPVAQYPLGRPVEARLAVPDGPAVRFEPAPVREEAPAPAAAAAAPPAAAPPAAAPPAAAPSGHAAPRKASDPLGGQLVGALRILVPMGAWLRDPAMRQWPRLLVTAYALAPLILLIVLQHNADLVTLGWVYCLYVAPLWALVFWFLIRPGPLGRLHLIVAAIIIAAEFVLIPALTLPWEHALAPPTTSHSLFGWVVGVGLPEELTKALPVMVLAIVLLKVRHIKLDVRMWMFLATLSGLFFGAYEASKVYVPNAILAIARGSSFGIRNSPSGCSWTACSTRCGRHRRFLHRPGHQLPAAADPAVAARHRRADDAARAQRLDPDLAVHLGGVGVDPDPGVLAVPVPRLYGVRRGHREAGPLHPGVPRRLDADGRLAVPRPGPTGRRAQPGPPRRTALTARARHWLAPGTAWMKY